MQIENGNLVVEVEGSTMTVPLPEVATAAKVKAYLVPEAYRPGRLFISVTVPGQPEDVPACSQDLVELLGEDILEASDAAILNAAKAAKLTEINAECQKAVAALAADYPDSEVQSWPQQVKEATALAADAGADAPLLTAIATARGLPVAELASRVLDKMNAYAAASGVLIGRRQAAEDAIGATASLEDLSAISW
ncbi:hypothetical protein [Pandoraea norimbergensis]|uniref:DUF4376 domain-containing protein n=1 Tax=Pandoraea norimbergensis TaxID=93219 RepID=A0ABM5WNV8_9BURK|nr:hypothetical protein [Pandoraea norimbergensis]ALS62241.1 hypothetical protein AT302_23105 [Pandoraea norimbergensis]